MRSWRRATARRVCRRARRQTKYLKFLLVLIIVECRESRVKIKRRARTEHTLNEASASNLDLFSYK
ncbi:hypothetical protein HanIR_Chr09g0391601 [Helianthus annuus]|nr:hypothetical protein HanIR_Chr09g0391601 [Helianthus annuus]